MGKFQLDTRSARRLKIDKWKLSKLSIEKQKAVWITIYILSKHVGHPVTILASGLTIPAHFRIRFEIQFGSRDTSSWANIFRISDGNNMGSCGSRFPALFIYPNSTTSIANCHCINGNTNYCFHFHQLWVIFKTVSVSFSVMRHILIRIGKQLYAE